MSSPLKKIDKVPDELEQMLTTKQERKVLELIRNLEYGEARIVVKKSAIVQIEEKKSISL